ncbi:MAG: PBP1A family penicillin-binding protein [bacterium]|nr:PBP1A family penicillin-binding protein [bacterium]
MKVKKISLSQDTPEKRRYSLLIWFEILAFVLVLFLIGIFYYFTRDLPKLSNILDYRPPLMTTLYDGQGEPFAEYYLQRRKLITPDLIPLQIKRAFVSAEDASFYRHEGISFGDIIRAFLINLKERRIVQGGSTITQQVAKTLLLTPERKISRKIREAILAYRIERNLNKEEILAIYLNQIYFGQGAYGIVAAAEVYFGKRVEELNLSEIAFLAALPRAPGRYSPYAYPQRVKERQIYVLNRMVEDGHITKKEEEEAVDQPLSFRRQQFPLHQAPYFAEHIRRYLQSRYGDEVLYQGGLKVYTTMSLPMQLTAENAVQRGLRELDKLQGYRGPIKRLAPSEYDAFIREAEAERNNSSVSVSVLIRNPNGKGYIIKPVSDPRTGPLKDKQIYRGLVTRIDPGSGAAEVKVGSASGKIAARDFSWIQRGLKPGDVVQVEVIGISPDSSGINPKYQFSLQQEPLVEGALVSMEPDTGFVLALVGGYDYNRSEFNRAIQALRSPGSAFKPIFYAAALENGYTPASIVVDSPMMYEQSDTAEIWKPKNYDEKFYGPITLREALAKSVNNVSIRILQDIGVNTAIDFARRIGIRSELAEDLSLALGSSGVTPLELISAYSVFANQGRKVEPIFIKEIRDREGKILEQNLPPTFENGLGGGGLFLVPYLTADEIAPRVRPDQEKAVPPVAGGTAPAQNEALLLESDQVVEPDIAFLITYLLEGVVQHGTGYRAKVLNRPVAGKTGTSDNNKDAWFVGYTPDLVAGVWVGFDDERSLGKFATGAQAAIPIWIEYMTQIMSGKPPRDFPVPPGIVFAKIDPENGLLATPETLRPVFEAFQEGTEPKDPSPGPAAGPQDDFFRMDSEEETAPPEAPDM